MNNRESRIAERIATSTGKKLVFLNHIADSVMTMLPLDTELDKAIGIASDIASEGTRSGLDLATDAEIKSVIMKEMVKWVKEYQIQRDR